eukprot:scaffold74273_cov57-Phaeocystis_antarctica.AAC.3
MEEAAVARAEHDDVLGRPLLDALQLLQDLIHAWRRLARAPAAVAEHPVGWPLPREVHAAQSQQARPEEGAGACQGGHFDHAVMPERSKGASITSASGLSVAAPLSPTLPASLSVNISGRSA